MPATQLLCPLDGQPLSKDGAQLRCTQGHSFDYARQGYVNLLPVQHKRSKAPGDSKEMVAARKRFLDSGAFSPISETLNALIDTSHPRRETPATIVDAACGNGYYLDQYISQRQSDDNCYGIDISKWAILAAAKRNKQIAWIVASNRQFPFEHQSIDILLSLFGFPNYDHFHQKLSTHGHLIVAHAGQNHLIELRQLLYPELKPVKKTELPRQFTLNEFQTTQTTTTLNAQQIADLLIMTPHGHRAPRERLEKAQALAHLEISLDVQFSWLRPL